MNLGLTAQLKKNLNVKAARYLSLILELFHALPVKNVTVVWKNKHDVNVFLKHIVRDVLIKKKCGDCEKLLPRCIFNCEFDYFLFKIIFITNFG